MHAPQFETRFTYDFICRFLPSRCERILEVGCGTGELAAHLAHHGFRITAIDTDEESIQAARQLGVDARAAEWPDFSDGPFDAVLFTRSLHHIHPLRDAVKSAAECLRADGRIIVEDFAYESTDEQTLRWFASTSRIVAASGLLIEPDELLDEILQKGASLAAWRANHGHDLNSAVQIAATLNTVFGSVIIENTAYYFRYLLKAVGHSNRRDALGEALAEQETELISHGAISPLGRRFVATRNV
jgi:SAM-dependent methyltransferase